MKIQKIRKLCSNNVIMKIKYIDFYSMKHRWFLYMHWYTAEFLVFTYHKNAWKLFHNIWLLQGSRKISLDDSIFSFLKENTYFIHLNRICRVWPSQTSKFLKIPYCIICFTSKKHKFIYYQDISTSCLFYFPNCYVM